MLVFQWNSPNFSKTIHFYFWRPHCTPTAPIFHIFHHISIMTLALPLHPKFTLTTPPLHPHCAPTVSPTHASPTPHGHLHRFFSCSKIFEWSLLFIHQFWVKTKNFEWTTRGFGRFSQYSERFSDFPEFAQNFWKISSLFHFWVKNRNFLLTVEFFEKFRRFSEFPIKISRNF